MGEGTVGHMMPLDVTAAVRTVGTVPIGFRFGKYPDGSCRLQGCYMWNEGIKHGQLWKDIPTVFVDQQGQAIYE